MKGYWSKFTYTVNDGYHGSKTGIVTLLESVTSHLVTSKFTDGKESWSVVANGNSGDTLVHKPVVSGLLNRYISANELEINTALPMQVIL